MSFIDRFRKNDEDDVAGMFADMEMVSQSLQLQLANETIDWNDETIQFFIPVVLNFTNHDWLRLIAKHSIYNDKFIFDFLDYVEELQTVNAKMLENKLRD